MISLHFTLQGWACTECAPSFYRSEDTMCMKCNSYVWILYIIALLGSLVLVPALLTVSKSQGFMSVNILVGTLQVFSLLPVILTFQHCSSQALVWCTYALSCFFLFFVDCNCHSTARAGLARVHPQLLRPAQHFFSVAFRFISSLCRVRLEIPQQGPSDECGPSGGISLPDCSSVLCA